ncbi:unnamed protein product [Camellia sinensis]
MLCEFFLLWSFICSMFYRKSYFSLYYWMEWEFLAKQLASLGAKLIISARNKAELERVKKQLSENSSGIIISSQILYYEMATMTHFGI